MGGPGQDPGGARDRRVAGWGAEAWVGSVGAYRTWLAIKRRWAGGMGMRPVPTAGVTGFAANDSGHTVWLPGMRDHVGQC